MAKIRNRAAFFKNPKKSADGLTAKERRRQRRKHLHEEWRVYQEKKESQQSQPPERRRVVIDNSREQGVDNSPMHRQSEAETFLDVHVDSEDYRRFLDEERRQVLVSKIRNLENQVRQKREREKQEKKEKKNS